jgi:hypothetical protein
MKRDFVSEKRRSKYYTVNNLHVPRFLDAKNANLFVMYVKARFQIKSKVMVPIFYLINSSGSMFDLIQLLNF